MTASFHKDGMFGPIKLLFMWPLTKPEKSEVMYLCLKFIDSVSFYIVFFFFFGGGGVVFYFLIWNGLCNFDTVKIDDVIKSSAKNTYSVICPM